MSTRSMIARQLPDGTYTGIYCHFDGYPECVGDRLVQHYNSTERATALINIGDISALDADLDVTRTLTYNQPATRHETLEALLDDFRGSWCEYGYIWNGTQWTCTRMRDGQSIEMYTAWDHPIVGKRTSPAGR